MTGKLQYILDTLYKQLMIEPPTCMECDATSSTNYMGVYRIADEYRVLFGVPPNVVRFIGYGMCETHGSQHPTPEEASVIIEQRILDITRFKGKAYLFADVETTSQELDGDAERS